MLPRAKKPRPLTESANPLHHRHLTLVIPHWRSTLRHALPNVIEGKIVPVALFLGLLHAWGTNPALVGALIWSLAALARRHLKSQKASGLLILTTLGLVTRTVAALATGSLVVYFLQPTVSTALVAAVFLGSVLVGRPLVERLVMDFCPVDEEARSHPEVQRFFNHASLWWGFTSAANFGVTLWLLLDHSPTTFVLVKSVLGPVTTTITLLVATVWFRSLMARSGTRVVFADIT